MSDTPKFTVVDRRKFRAEEETETAPRTDTPDAGESYAKVAAAPAPAPGPRLTLVEPVQKPEPIASPFAVAEFPEPELAEADLAAEEIGDGYEDPQLPPAPTAQEALFQKTAYEKAAERLDDLVRAQNPGAPPTETIGFEHLVQQLYLSAMMQMGAGTPEGQRPRIDILGARQTIDLLNVVLDKSAGNLSVHEERTLQTVLYEVRMTFLELTRMISAQPQPPMPPPPGSPLGAKR